MKKELIQEIEIPEGVKAEVNEDTLIVEGTEGKNSKELKLGRLDIEIKGDKITLKVSKGTKTDKKLMNTIASHIRNMVSGVQNKFVYELKICHGHFPFTVKVEGNKGVIKNFLGEKVDRAVKIIDGVDIDIKKDIITVSSINKELAGQAAANFEAATKIKGRDKRVFQDGIYIIKKNGKEI